MPWPGVWQGAPKSCQWTSFWISNTWIRVSRAQWCSVSPRGARRTGMCLLEEWDEKQIIFFWQGRTWSPGLDRWESTTSHLQVSCCTGGEFCCASFQNAALFIEAPPTQITVFWNENVSFYWLTALSLLGWLDHKKKWKKTPFFCLLSCSPHLGLAHGPCRDSTAPCFPWLEKEASPDGDSAHHNTALMPQLSAENPSWCLSAQGSASDPTHLCCGNSPYSTNRRDKTQKAGTTEGPWKWL